MAMENGVQKIGPLFYDVANYGTKKAGASVFTRGRFHLTSHHMPVILPQKEDDCPKEGFYGFCVFF
jgi:hypothetical protein